MRCMAGRTPLDEAAAVLLAQISNAHGLRARVEPADALSSTGILQLDLTGVAIVCLSYLDASSPAHMRYSGAAFVANGQTPKSCSVAGPSVSTKIRWRPSGRRPKRTWLLALCGVMMICRSAAGMDELDGRSQPMLQTTERPSW